VYCVINFCALNFKDCCKGWRRFIKNNIFYIYCNCSRWLKLRWINY